MPVADTPGSSSGLRCIPFVAVLKAAACVATQSGSWLLRRRVLLVSRGQQCVVLRGSGCASEAGDTAAPKVCHGVTVSSYVQGLILPKPSAMPARSCAHAGRKTLGHPDVEGCLLRFQGVLFHHRVTL
jgi:hypothetical protein